MRCKVQGCRFSDKHRTIDHECGSCHQKSHGQIECKDFSARCRLLRIIEEEEADHLTVVVRYGAADKTTSDMCSLSLSRAAGVRAALDRHPGCYLVTSMGMGCCQYWRHTGTIIEYFFLCDTVDQTMEGNPGLRAFVDGYTRIHSCPRRRR